MPKRVRINLGAGRQMVQFVKALIRILLARLSQLFFPVTGTGGEWRGGCLERGSEIRFQNLKRYWRELFRRGLDRLSTAIVIKRESVQRPGIANNDRLHRRVIWWQQVLSPRIKPSPVPREVSPEMGLRQILEPEATTSSGIASEPVQEPQTTRSIGGDHFGGQGGSDDLWTERRGGDVRKAEAGGRDRKR